MSTLSDLITNGKVRAVGSSSFLASDIVEAQWVSKRRRLTRLRTEQPSYSILARDSGLSMTHLAMSFVTAHLAIASAISGPRTLDQLDDLLLAAAAAAAAEVTLPDDVLDRIDTIVPFGTDVGYSEVTYTPPSLVEPHRRRRSLRDRSAA